MSELGHGDLKYKSRRLGELTVAPYIRIEHRRLESGVHAALTLECNEVVIALAGRSHVRRTGNGETQESSAQPGTTWVCPAGTSERDIRLSDPIESLHIYLPPSLIERSALERYEMDPSRVELAYVGGFTDLKLHQVGVALFNLLGNPVQPADRLFVEGMRTALVASLLGHYTVDRWQRPNREPDTSSKRLKRVTDFIDAHFADDLSLDALAAQACVSAFHFSRLFREATGVSPYRYATNRRIEAAQRLLAANHLSLVEIALRAGFGSQDNFTRQFRKITGLTPRQYRELHRR